MDYLSIISIIVLLAAPTYLLWRMGGSLLRRAVSAAVLMVVGLSVTGLCLKWLYAADSMAFTILWLAAVSVVAAYFMVREAGGSIRAVVVPSACALFATSVVVASYVSLLVLRSEGVWGTRWMAPLGGLMLVCAQRAAATAVSEYRKALSADRQQYEYLLGNGASHFEAVMPFVRRAVAKGLAPLLNRIGLVGIGVLPLALLGMVMGGMSPMDAALTLMAVMLGGLSAAVMATFLALYLFDRRAFDVYGRLKGRDA